MANTELATKEQSFELVTLDSDLKQIISEELDGLGPIQFDRIKIPSGGTLAFEVPTEDEENPDVVKELKAVIIYHHPLNAYWKNKFDGSIEQPECSSFDNKTGTNRDTGLKAVCSDCPYNQFKSDVEGGKGKACKNMHRLFLLVENNPVPIILTLPPTSIKALKEYLAKRIVLRGKQSNEVVTKISLKKETSATGIAYSKAVFSKVGDLTDSQKKAVSAMSEIVKSMYAAIDIEDDDYNTSGTTTQDGFVNQSSDEELPFN